MADFYSNYTFDNFSSTVACYGNVTCEDGDKVIRYRIAVPIVIGFCLLSVLANFYILFTVKYLTRSPSPTLYFTLSLTFADAWVCIAMAISFVIQSYLPYVVQINVENALCFGLAYEAIRMGAMITSVLHLTLLAVNHYAAIARPLHYQSLVTPRLAVVSIAVVWLTPPLVLLLYFSSVPNQAFRSVHCAELTFFGQFQFRAAVSSAIFVPLIFVCGVYSKMFYIIVRSRRNKRWHCKRKEDSVAARRRTAANVKAAITTGLMVGAFVFGWMPSVFMFLLMCHNCVFDLETFRSGRGQIALFYLTFFSNVAIILKSLIDPLIYATRVKEIKLALYTMHPYCFGKAKLVEVLEKIDMSKLSIRTTGSSTLSKACREVALSRCRHQSMIVQSTAEERQQQRLDRRKSEFPAITESLQPCSYW